MTTEITAKQINADIKDQIEELARFISEESVKSDNAVNGSNWLIFDRYNKSFNAIALEMGYDLTREGNEDWTAVKAINKQITSPDWYEGKSRGWLQQARRILRVVSEIHEKCIADNALEEFNLKSLSYEKCRLISCCDLPLIEKRELWGWMLDSKPSCRELRVELRERGKAHKHLEAGKSIMEHQEDSEELGHQEAKCPQRKIDLDAIAAQFISKVKSDEIIDAKNLIREIAIHIQNQQD